MFTFFIGEDTVKARKALRSALEKEKEARPQSLVSRFDDLNFDVERIREALGATSLFGGGENIIVLDDISSNKEGKLFIEEILAQHANTENIVLVREKTLSKEFVKKFKKANVETFPLAAKTTPKVNSFAIADALARKDKRTAWVEFERARRRGDAMEGVHGTIFWAMKMLFICATQKKEDAIRSGVHAYKYRDYQEGAKRFLLADLEHKLGELKDMYHRAHRGEGELDIFLEQFLLRL